jgi:N-methylhydantoinase A/oxoprolinase/acetone carboxylase beta subunit
MPGGNIDEEEVAHRPMRILTGRLTISGSEIEPPDRDEIRAAAAQLKNQEGVNVFAISGYAGAVNPDHELLVKQIAMEETGLHACCGHELSDLYNFFVRANTAVLNARIIPLLEAFLEDIETSLHAKGIKAPVMVVKGDGSLMSCDAAKLKPIETILSGPAASIAGAKYLLSVPDATVIDIGGTTSDIGTLKAGMVEVCSQGAKVGGWRTHVQALDMSTVGLGGDSEIVFEKQELFVGPRRIAPISWLGAGYDIADQLGYLEKNIDGFSTTTTPVQFLVKTGTGEALELTGEEKKILTALEQGPCSIMELADRTGDGYWLMLRFKRLEDHYVVQRCGLTPTDILHIRNEMDLWNREAGLRMARIMCRRAEIEIDQLADRVNRISTRRILTELLKKQFPGESEPDSMDSCPACQTLLDTLFGGKAGFTVDIHFDHPVVGLGAPASHFLQPVSDYIDADITIPKHAEVANAVGAITSSVMVKKEVSIIPTAEGTFAVLGIPGHATYRDFEKARKYATDQLKVLLQEMAETAGTSEKQVRIRIDDRIASAADGSEVFLECRLAGEVVGIPDMAGVP